eukprot:gene25812-biopygen12030
MRPGWWRVVQVSQLLRAIPDRVVQIYQALPLPRSRRPPPRPCRPLETRWRRATMGRKRSRTLLMDAFRTRLLRMITGQGQGGSSSRIDPYPPPPPQIFGVAEVAFLARTDIRYFRRYLARPAFLIPSLRWNVRKDETEREQPACKLEWSVSPNCSSGRPGLPR